MNGFFKKTLSFLGLSDEDDMDHKDRVYERKKEFRNRGLKREDNKPDPGQSKENKGRASIMGSRAKRKVPLIGSPKDKMRSTVFISEPKKFEEIQVIADNFKEDIPIVVNLQKIEQDLAKRVIDFCSGLTYALEGNISKVADKVFLITPYNVEVSSEEKELLREEGLYNNF